MIKHPNVNKLTPLNFILTELAAGLYGSAKVCDLLMKNDRYTLRLIHNHILPRINELNSELVEHLDNKEY